MRFNLFELDFSQSFYKRESQTWDTKVSFDLMINVNPGDLTELLHVQYHRTYGRNVASAVHINGINLMYGGRNQIEPRYLSDCRSHYFIVRPLIPLSEGIKNEDNEYHYSFRHALHENKHFKKTT